MLFQVVKPFHSPQGYVHMVGSTIELKDADAARLRVRGLIVGVVPKVATEKAEPPERSEKPETKDKPASKRRPPVETATKRPTENTALR